MRKRGSALPIGLAVAPPPDDAGKKTVTEALQEIRDRIDPVAISGVLAATRDGLVLCAHTRDIENESVAAMAAAAAGLAAQFIARASVGDPRVVFFEGDAGQVGVFSVDPDTLLVVFSERNTTMGMFNVAAKQALALLQQAIAGQR
ncbi:putative regulator of Ras-like GTPase activity (Roadblock/LC7/MglB family) [Lentzea nigeriaca]|nr:putative regulator of Ras-like GTPase activity (Roadblock/LC7/MglB family) [Lentzea nigeriaca]